MRRFFWLAGVLGLLLSFTLAPGTVQAADNWNKVVSDVEKTLSQALQVYAQGDAAKAKEIVNDAYYESYESGQMEKAVKFNISGKRNADNEEEFRQIRKLMTAGAPKAEVKKRIDGLVDMLEADAAKLNNSTGGPLSLFLQSLLIIVREGFEAILVIGALIAYLVKSGNGNKVRVIYQSALIALAASVVTAFGFKYVFKIGGASQENMEGITMLIAVAVLFWVSFWLISKSEAEKWKDYINSKVKSSLTGGSTWTLWFAAFLAVYREGAETALFYQALVAGEKSGSGISLIGAGFAVGVVVLAVIYVIIRYGSVRIPLKPFFIVTSILLYYMAFTFAGNGVNELQAGTMVSVTTVPGVPVIPFLGVYPTAETLAAQGLLAAVTLAFLLRYWLGGSKKKEISVS